MAKKNERLRKKIFKNKRFWTLNLIKNVVKCLN